MLYVTCVGHLYVQGYRWSGGQYVLRDIQDIFTVGAQTVLALKVERKDCELSSALFATYWNSQEGKPIKAKTQETTKYETRAAAACVLMIGVKACVLTDRVKHSFDVCMCMDCLE